MAVRPINFFLVFQGIFALIASILLIVWPGPSAVVFSYLVGTWFILDALLAFAAWLARKTGTRITHAILSAVLGILILIAPTALLGVIVIIMSVVAIMFGAGVIAVSTFMKRVGMKSWWVGLVLGILSLLLGFAMPFFPADTITIGVYTAAVLLAVYGILSLMLARRITSVFRMFRSPDGSVTGWAASGSYDSRGGRGDDGPDVIKGEIADD